MIDFDYNCWKETVIGIFKAYSKSPYLQLIPFTKLSEYDYTLINEYVSYREFRGLSNIYTGNILPNELAEYVGTRLASRILNGLNCVTITLTGGDRRNGSVANNFSHLSI